MKAVQKASERKPPYILSPQEVAICLLAEKDVNIFAGYWFAQKEPGDADSAFKFDYRVDPPWQKQYHHSKQKTIFIVGGVGSGKTAIGAASAIVYAMTTPDYKFMNVAPTAFQARQMFESCLQILPRWMDESRGVYVKEHPYPQIEFINSHVGRSVMLFLSTGETSQAKRILGWEGDHIHYDECGLDDMLDQTIIKLRSRLRGKIRGRDRTARMTMTSNPHDNPAMWNIYDKAYVSPVTHWSYSVDTRSNKNITEEQLSLMLADIDPMFHDQWLSGQRPEISAGIFYPASVNNAEDASLDLIMKDNMGVEGYEIRVQERVGVINWQLPPEKDRVYVVVMDPGQGNPPRRNAPVIMVWDITDAPNGPAVLRAFWWGFGNGTYKPCIEKYVEWFHFYEATVSYFDATGIQSLFSELFTLQHRIITQGISLSGGRKQAGIAALNFLMNAGKVKWPKDIRAIRSQLLKYELPDDKLAQDVVSCLTITALALRASYYGISEGGDRFLSNGSVQPIASRGFLVDRHSRANKARR